ncbi:MAG: hypothetical protein PWQ31_1557 [Eubacteriales bacterium]|nr:hypothetical protein [Eubacteriales bacterium]
MTGETILILLIAAGILGNSKMLATAASLLLILKIAGLSQAFSVLEEYGIDLGLLFLLLAVIAPFAAGHISPREIFSSLCSVAGILAVIGGILATHLNGRGLELLKANPELMIGIVIGSLAGIVFFQGIPVGPLMAAGIMAFFWELYRLLKNLNS